MFLHALQANEMAVECKRTGWFWSLRYLTCPLFGVLMTSCCCVLFFIKLETDKQ